MFDFPNNPVVNQSVTAPNGGFFIWDGIKWTNGASPTPTSYLPLSGGTMVGPLILNADPSAPLGAATRQYVDAHTAVPTGAAGGDLSGTYPSPTVSKVAGVSGPFLPTVGGGTVTGPLNITATGTTASRAVQDRFAEVVNVRDFGAKGDGITDDTVAINAALNHARATTLPSSHWATHIVFPAGRYVVTGPLNFTGFTQIQQTIIDGCSSEIWLKSATAVIDCLSSRWMTFRDLTIYGDTTTPPKIGMQIGRITTQSADFISLYSVMFWGNYSQCAFYNFASETLSAYGCTFDNFATTTNAWCVIQDGINHFNASSTFVTVTNAVNTAQSNNSSQFDNCSFQATTPSGNVWMANANGHSYRHCYASNSSGTPFVLYFQATGAAATWLEIDCHCETTGLSHMLAFTGPAGVTLGLVVGLTLSDYDLMASVSALYIDTTSAITSMEIREAKFRFAGVCPALFDAPAKYSVRARECFINDNMWVMPALWSGPVTNTSYSGTVIVPENVRIVAIDGGSYTLFNNIGWVDLVPAANIPGGITITMPPLARHGQEVKTTTTKDIGGVVFTANTGQTVSGPLGPLLANNTTTYRYDGPTATWVYIDLYVPKAGGTMTGGLTVQGVTTVNQGLVFSGGTNAAGSIYTDANWGCLIRGRTGGSGDFGLQANDGAVLLTGKAGSVMTIAAATTFTAAGNALTVNNTLIGTGQIYSNTGFTSSKGFGMFGAAIVTTKPTVTGAKGSNAALASLLTALVSYGLITDSSTA